MDKCSPPDVPPKNHQKLSKYLGCIPPGTSFSTEGFEVGYSSQSNISADKAPSTLCTSEGPSRSYDGQAFGLQAEKTEDNEESGCIVSSSYGGNELRLLSSSGEMSDRMDVDTPETSTSTDENYPMSRRLDIFRLIDTFEPDEIDEIKLAADFLFATNCHENSFGLYVLLVKRLKDAPNSHAWMMDSAITGCARSSVTSFNAEIARNLLEQRLSELSANSYETPQAYLFRSLLGDIYHQQGNEAAGKFHHHLATQSEFAKNSSLLSFGLLPSQNWPVDLVTCQYLHRSLTSRGHPFVAARNVTMQLLHRDSNSFDHNKESEGNTSVRSCLKWCLSELHSDLGTTGLWMNLQQRGIKRGREEVLALFCELWQRWRRKSSTDGSASTEWANQVEESMGISFAELLVITCLMMLNACPRTFSLGEAFLPKVVFYQRVALQALQGANIISDMSDRELAHAFLKAYSTLNTPNAEGFADTEHTSLSRDYARSWLEQSLQLQLPEVRYTDNETSHTMAKFKTLQKNDSQKSLLPTITSSLKSDDYSCFRSLKERIEDHLEETLSGVQTFNQLPSSCMRNESRSTLSLSLSFPSNISQLALDTLATVSTHVQRVGSSR